MRVLVGALVGLRDAHLLEEADRLLQRLLGIEVLVKPQRLADLPAGLEDRVHGGHGILEDHRDLLAPDLLHLRVGGLGQVAPLVEDPAARDAARALEQPHHAEHRHRLTGARLADDAQRFPGIEVEGDAVDGFDHPVLGGKDGVEILDLQ